MTQVRLSVYYPTTEGATFDHDYYKDKHVPLCVQTWQPEAVTIERGTSGPNIAAVHFTFASVDALNAALAHPDMKTVGADLANYTTISPIMQISDVVS